MTKQHLLLILALCIYHTVAFPQPGLTVNKGQLKNAAYEGRMKSQKPMVCLQILKIQPVLHTAKSWSKLNMSSNSDDQEQRRRKKALGIPSNPDDVDFSIEPYIIYTTSILGISSALVLLWSEISIALTRCGPTLLPDAIERSAYISVFIIASGSNLSRIIFGSSMADLMVSNAGGSDLSGKPLEEHMFRFMETLTFLSILGAFGLMAWQVLNGDAFADGAGMSGIDIRWCRLMNEG